MLKRPPRTRELYEKHTQRWPLIFHASVQESATSSPIEEIEKQNMEKHLKVAVQVGGSLKKERQETLRCAWGCVVVDPEADELVATSTPTENMQIRYAFEMLYHPVMVAINGVAERDRKQSDELKVKMAHKKQKCCEKEDAAGRKLIETTNNTKPSDSYLCTGYDVYLDQEPCAMCAMALVHSRARHVVFDRANPSDGVLLSSFKLHTIKSINHHYRVFQLPLSEGVEQSCM